MRLQDFVQEMRDNNSNWAGLFEKYDCVFLASEEEFPQAYECFKHEMADALFDLRYGQKHLFEQIESYYQIRLQESAWGCTDTLKSFLEMGDRPKYSEDRERFVEALREYVATRKSNIGVSCKEFVELTTELFGTLDDEIRECFVHYEDKSQEFAQMTSQVGEILATLVFEQLRGCGLFTQAKIDLDNPKMPRHGEDLLAFFFREAVDGTHDELFLVEAKSTKGSISQPVREIRDRFNDHLRKLPGYEIARLKRVIEEKIGPQRAALPRRRISQLIWRAKLDPENAQLKFSPFLHHRKEYCPRTETLSTLGEIKANPSRIHVIVFEFADFEQTVKEIFEKAWTI